MLVTCPICRGEYDTVTRDGLEYYHRCPPLPAVRLRLADGTRAQQLGRRYVDVTQDPLTKAITYVDRFDPPLPLGAVFLGETTVERPDARDENVVATGPNKGLPKAPGADPSEVKAPA